MGAKREALAKRFEAKAQEAVAVVEELSDTDWKKLTGAEKWTVGVTAHHVATALEAVAGMATAIVVSMDKMIGGKFEKGLANLESVTGDGS